MATETDQPTTEPNPPAAEQAKEESSNPAPAETASNLDLNAESFLHDFSPDEVLESEEDSDAQLARDAIDLEASLNDAEASPVVTLVVGGIVGSILLAMYLPMFTVFDQIQ